MQDLTAVVIALQTLFRIEAVSSKSTAGGYGMSTCVGITVVWWRAICRICNWRWLSDPRRLTRQGVGDRAFELSVHHNLNFICYHSATMALGRVLQTGSVSLTSPEEPCKARGTTEVLLSVQLEYRLINLPEEHVPSLQPGSARRVAAKICALATPWAHHPSCCRAAPAQLAS